MDDPSSSWAVELRLLQKVGKASGVSASDETKVQFRLRSERQRGDPVS